jgi:hypothetical protein
MAFAKVDFEYKPRRRMIPDAAVIFTTSRPNKSG